MRYRIESACKNWCFYHAGNDYYANRPDYSMLAFRDPSSFVPGQLHNNLAQWECIAEQFPSQDEPMCFIRDKVDVATFIVPLKGKFGGNGIS